MHKVIWYLLETLYCTVQFIIEKICDGTFFTFLEPEFSDK